MKKYENPMLQVISIKHDIVTESTMGIYDGTINTSSEILAPGRRGFDEWYEGF